MTPKTRRPAAKPKLPSEASIQTAIVRIIGLACPDHVQSFHCPNGEARSAATGAKLKRLGVRPGIPDLIFHDTRTGRMYCMEVKGPRGVLSPQQLAWKRVYDLSPVGRYAVVRSVEEAYTCLMDWWPMTTRKMTVGVNKASWNKSAGFSTPAPKGLKGVG